MGMITINITDPSANVNSTTVMSVSDADLGTLYSWIQNQTANNNITVVAAVEWLAESWLKNTVASIQKWQLAQAYAAAYATVVPPPTIAVTIVSAN